MSERHAQSSELLDVLKKSSAFRKDWGMLVGAYFFHRAISAASRCRSVLRLRWITFGIAIVTTWAIGVGFLEGASLRRSNYVPS